MRGLTLVVLFAAAAAAKDLTLDEALRAALDRPSSADARVEIARDRIALLETAGKHRLEFRPQVGLFSLTNPLSLIAGLGIFGGSSTVSPAALINAQIDLLDAEAQKGREQFQREAEATRQYYDLWDRQQSEALSCSVQEKAAVEHGALSRRLAAGEITRLEVLRSQRRLLDGEAECRRAEREVKLAGIRLARLVGTSEEHLRAADRQPENAEPRHGLRPVAYLVKVALGRRPEAAGLRERIAAWRAKIDKLHQQRAFQVSLFASNAGVTQQAVSGMQPGFVFSMPMARNATFQLEKRLLQLKLRAVEDEAENLEQDIRAQVAEMRTWYEARREESDAAVERAALAVESRQAIEARREAGLESPDQLAAAVEEERHAATELVSLRTHGRAALSVLLSISGLRAQPEKAAGELLFAQY